MACFADINVSQGSVATYARCGGIFNMHLTANLPTNLPVIFLESVKIWKNCVCGSVFFAHPVYRARTTWQRAATSGQHTGTWVSRYQKGKTSRDLTEAREMVGFCHGVASAGPHANNMHLAPHQHLITGGAAKHGLDFQNFLRSS